MSLLFSNTRRINRFLNYQANTSFYYRKMAFITTEEDLKKIFSALANHHDQSRKKLEAILYPNKSIVRDSVRKGKSYLSKTWRDVTIALLVNNREKLLEFSRQAEIKLLQEIPALLNHFSNEEKIATFLTAYEKGLHNYIKKLGRANVDHPKARKVSA